MQLIMNISMTISLQRTKKARRPSIAVQCPHPASPPAITRSNNRVRSDGARMSKDDKWNARRFKDYLEYAPKIVLPLTLRSLRKPLTKNDKFELEQKTEKLLAPSRPARCTSAQYLDRNGEPLLYYFGRRLVRPDDKTVSWYLLLPSIRLTRRGYWSERRGFGQASVQGSIYRRCGKGSEARQVSEIGSRWAQRKSPGSVPNDLAWSLMISTG